MRSLIGVGRFDTPQATTGTAKRDRVDPMKGSAAKATLIVTQSINGAKQKTTVLKKDVTFKR